MFTRTLRAVLVRKSKSESIRNVFSSTSHCWEFGQHYKGNACYSSPGPWNQAKSLWGPESTCSEDRCSASGSCPGCRGVFSLRFLGEKTQLTAVCLIIGTSVWRKTLLGNSNSQSRNQTRNCGRGDQSLIFSILKKLIFKVTCLVE